MTDDEILIRAQAIQSRRRESYELEPLKEKIKFFRDSRLQALTLCSTDENPNAVDTRSVTNPRWCVITHGLLIHKILNTIDDFIDERTKELKNANN